MPLTVRTTIIQLLAKGQGCGLELVDRVDSLTDGAIKLPYGTLYPALQALLDEGVLEEVQDRKNGHGRPRRTYRLTPVGQDEADQQRKIIFKLLGE